MDPNYIVYDDGEISVGLFVKKVTALTGKLTKIITIMALFLLLAIDVFADGFSLLKLEHVLPQTDTIILVEIIENKQTIKVDGEESVTYTNDIKSRVLSTHVGEFPGKEYSTKYSLVLVKGVWLMIPGSGLERRMKPGEKYVFLLEKNGGKYSLLRAEKAESLEIILRLKMDQTDTESTESIRLNATFDHFFEF